MQEKMIKSDATNARVALLIDTDNISCKHADTLFKKAASYGNIVVRKAYGQGVPNFPWPKEVILAYAIEPVMRFVSVPGKNISDIALVVGAMDLMHRNLVDTICIASNDSDFSLLAMKLRENGIAVYGFGTDIAQKSFVASCDEFIYLSDGQEADGKTQDSTQQTIAEVAEKENMMGMAGIKKAIKGACDSLHSDDEGWIHLGEVGKYLRRVDPAFSVKRYGFNNLRKLVDNLAEFDVRHNEETLKTSIRKTLKTKGVKNNERSQ